jgi:hypothetical protein
MTRTFRVKWLSLDEQYGPLIGKSQLISAISAPQTQIFEKFASM